MVPGKGRTPWREIGNALRDIEYDGTVVMEPFVSMGGQVGRDIHIWRDISRGASEAELDEDAKNAVAFQKYAAKRKPEWSTIDSSGFFFMVLTQLHFPLYNMNHLQ